MRLRFRTVTLLVAALSLVPIAVVPAVSAQAYPLCKAGTYSQVERSRYYKYEDGTRPSDRPYSEIALMVCLTDDGRRLYHARMTNVFRDDTIGLYYKPYGRGLVPNASMTSNGTSYIMTNSYYGNYDELQACFVRGRDFAHPIACTW